MDKFLNIPENVFGLDFQFLHNIWILENFKNIRRFLKLYVWQFFFDANENVELCRSRFIPIFTHVRAVGRGLRYKRKKNAHYQRMFEDLDDFIFILESAWKIFRKSLKVLDFTKQNSLKSPRFWSWRTVMNPVSNRRQPVNIGYSSFFFIHSLMALSPDLSLLSFRVGSPRRSPLCSFLSAFIVLRLLCDLCLASFSQSPRLRSARTWEELNFILSCLIFPKSHPPKLRPVF